MRKRPAISEKELYAAKRKSAKVMPLCPPQVSPPSQVVIGQSNNVAGRDVNIRAPHSGNPGSEPRRVARYLRYGDELAEHWEKIKTQVLDRLKEELERFYLPLVRGQIGPVMRWEVQIPLAGSLTQNQTITEVRLFPRREYGEQPHSFSIAARPVPTVDPVLYADTKKKHLRKFIARLEVFKEDFVRYTESWQPYAECLSQTIAERVGLPMVVVVTQDMVMPSSSWVDSKGLAALLVGCQLGAPKPSFCINPNPPSLDIPSCWRMAQAQSPEQINLLTHVLDELSLERRTVEDLRRPAKPLESEAAKLLDELNLLLERSKLPGRCPLVRV